MARKDKWDGSERRSPATVLVVGDDAGSNELVSRLLAARGFRPEVASSSDEAMVKASTTLPRCVVLDLASGGIGSNLKILESLRNHSDRRLATTRVVLVARSAANRVFSFQSGVDEFLTRPFHANELTDMIVSALRRKPEERAEHRRRMLETPA